MSSIEWLQADEEGRFPVDQANLEVISLGERFPLFKPTRTVLGFNELSQVPVYSSRILFDTHGLPLFPLNIKAMPIKIRDFGGKREMLTRRQVITPFHPEMGYVITREDIDEEARREKVGKLRLEAGEKNNQGDFDYQKTDPLEVFIGAPSFDLHHTDLYKKDTGYDLDYKFREDVLQTLRQLRMILRFPCGLYDSRAMNRYGLEMGGIYFHEYVPIDSPHLPELSLSIREGFCIFVPTDPASILQIEGELVRVGS